ncbi:MAG: GNAT family N-acetyltransferase [Alphaproteobacteria bacterium]|jgi:GNAT superfamily N-acetyltransferase|nr:GNAT family N-acetyltransferase [Alphaproteobacteria bacterium]
MAPIRRLKSTLAEPDGALSLNRATVDDSDFAFDMKTAAFRPYVEQSLGWDEVAQRQQHQHNFARHDYRVITVDGAARGIMSLAVASGCVKVNQLFLAPEYQGDGIGARCMALIIAEAESLGLPVRLRVMKVNPRAKAFYERLDFSVVSEVETHFMMERALAS